MRVLTLITAGLLIIPLTGCYVYPASPYPYPYYGSYYGDAYYDYSSPYANPYYAVNGYPPAGPQVAGGPGAPDGPDQQYCREYTYKIKVENSMQDAHGTACRQPDGSWKEVD